MTRSGLWGFRLRAPAKGGTLVDFGKQRGGHTLDPEEPNAQFRTGANVAARL